MASTREPDQTQSKLTSLTENSDGENSADTVTDWNEITETLPKKSRHVSELIRLDTKKKIHEYKTFSTPESPTSIEPNVPIEKTETIETASHVVHKVIK